MKLKEESALLASQNAYNDLSTSPFSQGYNHGLEKDARFTRASQPKRYNSNQ